MKNQNCGVSAKRSNYEMKSVTKWIMFLYFAAAMLLLGFLSATPVGYRFDPEIARPCPRGGCLHSTVRPTPCIKTVIDWNPRLNLPCDFNGHIRQGPIIIGPTPLPGPIFIPAFFTTQTIVIATPPALIPFPTYFTKSAVIISAFTRATTLTLTPMTTTTSSMTNGEMERIQFGSLFLCILVYCNF